MFRSNKAFTLLELLVVVLIIGITVSFITLTVDTRIDKIDLEARRLAALLNLVQEEAVLNGSEYALQFTKNNYSFLYFAEGKWKEIKEDDVLKVRSLPEGIELQLVLEGEEVDLSLFNQEFDAGMTPPRLFLLSSGEFTPYEITMKDSYNRAGFQLMPGENGRAKVVYRNEG